MTGSASADPPEARDPFDLAYELLLAVVQHVRRRVKDLASARERIELQVQDLEKQAEAFEGVPEAATDTRDERPGQDLPSRRSAVDGQIADAKIPYPAQASAASGVGCKVTA